MNTDGEDILGPVDNKYTPSFQMIHSFDLYDIIPKANLDYTTFLLLYNFNIMEELVLDNFNSDYCVLSFDKLNNMESVSEYIVNSNVNVYFDSKRFNGVKYALTLFYYDLETGDIDDSHSYDKLKEKTIELSIGDNIISFDEELIYLQKECVLIINGVDKIGDI